MALARSRASARRVKDKWKAKKWYKVQAPAAFNNILLAESLADDPEKMLGRTVQTTMQELTGDMKQMHIKLTFQVTDTQDFNAKTEFTGHTMTSDYVRRLTRRGHTKIPAVFDLKTKDGSRIRVKPFAVSDRRCQTTQAQAIRKVMHEHLEKAASESTLTGFLQKILVGDLNQEVYKAARKIHPIRRVEIAKSEVTRAPTVEMDETPIVKPEEPEPEPSEEGEETEAAEGEEAEASEGEEGEEPAADSEDEGEEAETVDADSEEE